LYFISEALWKLPSVRHVLIPSFIYSVFVSLSYSLKSTSIKFLLNVECDILIVGLQTDPTIDRPDKNKPIQTLEEREIQLKSNRYVDFYFIYDNFKFQNSHLNSSNFFHKTF
jgi:hypothetical protein